LNEADKLVGIVVLMVERPGVTKVKLGVIVAIRVVTVTTLVTVSLLVDAYSAPPLVQKATPSPNK